MDFESLIIYSSIMIIALFFAYSVKYTRQKEFMFILSFFTLFIFTATRFGVGNDYMSYITNFYHIRNTGEYFHELGFFLPSILLKDFKYGYLVIFALYAFFTYFFLFLVFIEKRIFMYGILFIFTTNFLYMSNDQIRQGLAIAIFIYSIKYIKSRNFYRYTIIIFLITFVVHYSSIILFPVYFIYRLKLSTKTLIVALISFTVLSYAGFFSNITLFVIKNIPYYGEHYTKIGGGRLLVPEKLNSGLAHLFWILIAFFITYNRSKVKEDIYFKIYILGVFLHLVFFNYLLTRRITYFFTYVDVIVFSLYLKNEKNTLLRRGFIVGSVAFFLLSILINANGHGAFPYKSFLFSKIEYVKKNRISLKK